MLKPVFFSTFGCEGGKGNNYSRALEVRPPCIHGATQSCVMYGTMPCTVPCHVRYHVMYGTMSCTVPCRVRYHIAYSTPQATCCPLSKIVILQDL